MACSLYFISVFLVSKNPEILSNPMPQNQINGVDETANVTVEKNSVFSKKSMSVNMDC